MEIGKAQFPLPKYFPRKYPQGYGSKEGTIPTSCLSIVSHVDIPRDMGIGKAQFSLHV